MRPVVPLVLQPVLHGVDSRSLYGLLEGKEMKVDRKGPSVAMSRSLRTNSVEQYNLIQTLLFL